MRLILRALLLMAAVAFYPARSQAGEWPPASVRKADFVDDSQAIVSGYCYSCHGPKKQEAQLRWDSREIALQGGEHGLVLVPGKSDQSKMIRLVAGLDPENVMPK